MSPALRSVCRAVPGGLLLWLAALCLSAAPPVGAQAEPALAPPLLKAMSGGQGHTCVLTEAGAVLCWGSNRDGLLGDGTTNSSWSAVTVAGLDSGVQAIAAGWPQTCAITAEGGVLCWGTFSLTPVPVAGLDRGVQAIAVSGHACAVNADGGVQCWGRNNAGQLGDGTREWWQTPVDVAGLTGSAQAVATGEEHSCALLDDGGVQCWGSNTIGQLGDGTTLPREQAVAVVGLAGDVQAIAAGAYHTCALLVNGAVQCWGSNSSGILGVDANLSHSPTPLAVDGLDAGVEQIVAGGAHTCALVASKGGRRVECWGANYSGQLGDGTVGNRPTPVEVLELDGDLTAIGAGFAHSCALYAGGGASCWGQNWLGELGSGSSAWQLLPAPVVDLPANVQAVAAGENHTCLLSGEAPGAGGVQCWGGNYEGQLGDGSVSDRSLSNRYQPAPVSGLADGVQAITAGNDHTCALGVGGGVQCWGRNATGQLGNGAELPSDVPVGVIGLGSGVQMVAAGRGHTCAVTSSGGVQCWGDNKGGQLGDGTQLKSSAPVAVVGLAGGVRAVAAGLGITCALTEGGGVQCWGAGRVGDGTRDLRTPPVDVAGLSSGVRSIEAGGDQTCAVREDGSVHCWGSDRLNIWDQDGGVVRAVPTPVTGWEGRGQGVATGGGHTCILAEDGAGGDAVQCWGFNFFGQVGVNPGWAPLDAVALLPRTLFAPLARQ